MNYYIIDHFHKYTWNSNMVLWCKVLPQQRGISWAIYQSFDGIHHIMLR